MAEESEQLQNSRMFRLLLTFRMSSVLSDVIAGLRIPVAGLAEEKLLAAAAQKTGLYDFGDERFLLGLRALLDSAEQEVDFHLLGRISFHHFLLRMLANRLLIQDAKKRQNLNDIHLLPPFIVTGLPRSGTTFLHRLLAEDPENRAPLLWELLEPVLPPAAVKRGRDMRRVRVAREMRMASWLAPDLDKKHYTRVDTPEECILLMASSFTSLLYVSMLPIYSYIDWFFEQDLSFAYQDYSTQLKLLQGQRPTQRLTLKAPAHLSALGTIKKVIPGAMIVQTHRDPVKCINSTNSLTGTLYSLMARNYDVRRMAKVNLDCLCEEIRRNVEFHQSGSNDICHISYRDLTRDPLNTVKGIYRHFNLPFKDAFGTRLEHYKTANPRHKHGVHRYRAETFGLTDSTCKDCFTLYLDRFSKYL